MDNSDPTREYIEMICDLYGDTYDDRLEDCKPPATGESIRAPGKDWVPDQVANHKSQIAFQRELEDKGIKLSSSKSVNLPYQNVVYYLENKSSNAKRCSRYKEHNHSNRN